MKTDVQSNENAARSARRGAGRQAAFGFIFASSVMNAISFGLMIPILPNLIRSFFGATSAASTAAAADWQAVFGVTWGLMQFISGPVLGLLSDRFGRRPVMLLSIFGLSLDFLVMAFAPSLVWLLLGRIFNGLTAASFSTANAYVADISTPETRAKNFGMMGAAFNIGFLLGPPAGGFLATHGLHIGSLALDPLRTPFLVAAALCAVNWIYGLLVLPESLPQERRAAAFEWSRANPLASLSLLRAYGGLLPLALVTFLFQLAQQALPNIFVLYTTLRYHWDVSFLGVTFLVTGALGILVQWFAVGPIVARLGERDAVIAGTLACVIGFVIYGLAPSGWLYFVGMPIFAFAGLTQPGLHGLMTRRVSHSEQGRLQGATQSTGGIAAILGPILFPLTFAFALRSAPALIGLPILIAAAIQAASIAIIVKLAPVPIASAARTAS
jgi:DHA1 family tetracycline resistance protein-like MFS transporter